MNKKILLVVGLLSLTIIGAATLSSYGSVTGYATVEKSIVIDIMGTSNDEVYNLKQVYQGETIYSHEIKLKNQIDESIDVNIVWEILQESVGNENDVEISIVDETKNVTLTNPITVPAEDLRFYVKHYFKPVAELGNYSFKLDVLPV
jgi:hypothetical protein